MADLPVTQAVDTFMGSANQTEMRANLALGDSATKNTGTTSGTVAAGDDSRIVGAVQTTRSISAGTGLSGGGSLASDRTLSVSFGNTAGTACEGNDSRLSNSRPPNGSASGDLNGTYPSPLVSGLYNRPLASAAPTNGQVLGWNGSQWTPMTVSGSGASEEFPVLAVLFMGPVSGQNYSIPTGYKWADLYLCSGGQGGNGGDVRTVYDAQSSFAASGGNGGATGVLRMLKEIWVKGSVLTMDLGAGGAGGAGGVIQGYSNGSPSYSAGQLGGNGGDSLVYFSTPPEGSPSYSNQRLMNAPYGGSRHSQQSWADGYGGGVNAQGATPTLTAWNSLFQVMIHPGAGGSGTPSSGIGPQFIDGAKIADGNEVMISNTGAVLASYEGNTNNGIDALQVPLFTNSMSFSGMFFGGAGGAGVYADAPNNSYSRGGNGSDAQPGCGGGGGGGCFVGNNLTDADPNGVKGGDGGDGGVGFLLLMLRK